MKSPILVAENITKSFTGNVKALDDVSVVINQGEVRCLAGENGSGKSTFVKIVSGNYLPDSGKITIGDTQYFKLTPITAINEGIQVIYQDLSLFRHLSVAENIAINKMIYNKDKFVQWRSVRDTARLQLERINVDLDLDQPIGNISIANRQLVAICRALALNAKILFMDEPTTALTKKEVDRLLTIVSDLKNKGLSIVFISHKLNEIFEVADSITVFRSGQKIGDFEAHELNTKKLSYYMTGREIEYPRYRRELTAEEKLLEVKNLSKKGNFEKVSFSIRKGDILGITGLLGSGRTELALSIFGLNPADSGDIMVEGKKVNIKAPQDALKYGIALLPEDRHTQSLFLNQSVNLNISSTILDNIKKRFGFIDRKRQQNISDQCVRNLNVNNKDTLTLVKNLSGGNQQKVVIGKWIVTEPKIFILDTPTVGIDIGSKAEIYEKIHEFAKQGMGIILISDEIEEVMANANKVLIMYDKQVVDYLEEDQLSSPDIAKELFEIINNPYETIKSNVRN
jgi:simple sugar transport system ATP-binding protein